ncbi:MAG: prolyl-tRNA synthetase associated domain-containing protein [Candidatus Gracilibacteria bacterium]|nr:prolyl-tRNA synthetase associated domain-containing protein [Candidatus Gracilibacteria bacterium]MDD5178819.1 prolyl-tRNA synthetase associated domain-containing protein [Candidatus Gracilibacteria bacterium]
MKAAEKVFAYLEGLGIKYQTHNHPPIFTIDDANQHWRNLRGMHCKNLFLRDREGKKNFLVVVDASKQVDLQALRRLIPCSKLSFGSPERLQKFLGLTPGSVSPFGLINDENREVKVIVDADCFSAEFVNFHPNTNTATLEITPNDFEKFLNSTKNSWRKMQIPELGN